MHPRDPTNGLVLDSFAGSGTVLIAAERTGRRARALEIDPHYVDVAVRRWESYIPASHHTWRNRVVDGDSLSTMP
jgi:DNA modification methylase